MKWYSVKKYKPPNNVFLIVRALTGYDKDKIIYFTTMHDKEIWSLNIMEYICIHDGPNNCIDVVGNSTYQITHFAIPDPITDREITMTKSEKVANIICFLSILFGEDESFRKILEFNPDYIIEKFERYVESTNVQYPWGMHPALRKTIFNCYIDKWHLELTEE